MWFKQLQLYRLSSTIDRCQLQQQLAKRAFIGATALEANAVGWVAPNRYQPQDYVYAAENSWLIAMHSEEKILPSSVVKHFTDERVAEIEASEARPVGRKERREIQGEIAEQLLARAFSRYQTIHAIIDVEQGYLWLNQTSNSKTERFLKLLRESVSAIRIEPIKTRTSPIVAMTEYLAGGAPWPYQLEDDCVLRANDNSEAEIRCKRHDLGTDEIRQHLKTGKQVVQLGLNWENKVAFVLNEQLQLKRLSFFDVVEEKLDSVDATDAAALFDAQLMLMVTTLRLLIDDLLRALDVESMAAPSASGVKEPVLATDVEMVN